MSDPPAVIQVLMSPLQVHVAGGVRGRGRAQAGSYFRLRMEGKHRRIRRKRCDASDDVTRFCVNMSYNLMTSLDFAPPCVIYGNRLNKLLYKL